MEGTFGAGTPRFAAATAAAAERVKAAKATAASDSKASYLCGDSPGDGKGKGEDSFTGGGVDGVQEEKNSGDDQVLAGFLSSVLRGLQDTESAGAAVRQTLGRVCGRKRRLRGRGAGWHPSPPRSPFETVVCVI